VFAVGGLHLESTEMAATTRTVAGSPPANGAVSATPRSEPDVVPPLPGFRYLPGALDAHRQHELMQAVAQVVAEAPLYRPSMPKTGKPFSVMMANCGPLGWVSDKAGYRYQSTHPETGRPWPAFPEPILAIWREFAGFPALPEACLINHYTAATKLGSHVDADEAETAAPVISVSLGDDAVFHVGGLKRGEPKTRMRLRSGDIVVLGGAARLAYHGVDRIVAGTSELVSPSVFLAGGRVNLTLRRVTVLR
jgi:DNA oxidative demethylase